MTCPSIISFCICTSGEPVPRPTLMLKSVRFAHARGSIAFHCPFSLICSGFVECLLINVCTMMNRSRKPDASVRAINSMR